jgi:hypothetical protein
MFENVFSYFARKFESQNNVVQMLVVVIYMKWTSFGMHQKSFRSTLHTPLLQN